MTESKSAMRTCASRGNGTRQRQSSQHATKRLIDAMAVDSRVEKEERDTEGDYMQNEPTGRPVQHPPAQPPKPPAKGVDYGFITMIMGAVGGAVGLLLIIYAVTKKSPPKFSPEAEAAASTQAAEQAKKATAERVIAEWGGRRAPAPPPPEPSKFDRLMATTDMREAMKQIPFGDAQDGFDDGAKFFAAWATKNMKWNHVDVGTDETSFAKVMKDADAERGRRLCVRGTVVEIQASKDDGLERLYYGEVAANLTNIASFIAVGDTGEIVEQSVTRFCGIVTGRRSYANSGGGATHTIQLVGLFDLPANHKR